MLIKINDKISYLEASDNPLSADIGIIRSISGKTWLFDIGANEKCLKELEDNANVVLSHFHKDHTNNIDKYHYNTLYVSNETYKHVSNGEIVSSDMWIDDIHIFLIPSSHAKGCLALEIDDYCFVGDSLYSKVDDAFYIFNSQQLKALIDLLKRIKACYLLVSHFENLIRPKEDVIKELERIYSKRDKQTSLIRVRKRG